jgi:hypothetical protein
MDKYSKHPILEIYLRAFKTKMPPVVLDFKHSCGSLAFSDPELVNEIYVSKNKYFDKHEISRNIMGKLIGNGLVF